MLKVTLDIDVIEDANLLFGHEPTPDNVCTRIQGGREPSHWLNDIMRGYLSFNSVPGSRVQLARCFTEQSRWCEFTDSTKSWTLNDDVGLPKISFWNKAPGSTELNQAIRDFFQGGGEDSSGANKHSGSKYRMRIRDIDDLANESPVIREVTADVYEILIAAWVTCPAVAHAIKKLLFAGARDKGNRLRDLSESIDAIKRAIQDEKTKSRKITT